MSAEAGNAAILKGEEGLWRKVELTDPCDLASMPRILIFVPHLYYLISNRHFYSLHYRGAQPQSFKSALV